MIASRVVTIYFLAWLVSDVFYLPGDIYSAHFYWAARIGRSYDHYIFMEYIRALSVHVIRIALAFVAAGWSYRCGPGVIRFLFPESEESADES